MSSRGRLTGLLWIVFAASKSLPSSVLLPEQSDPVQSLVLTGEQEKIRSVQHTLDRRGGDTDCIYSSHCSKVASAAAIKHFKLHLVLNFPQIET